MTLEWSVPMQLVLRVAEVHWLWWWSGAWNWDLNHVWPINPGVCNWHSLWIGSKVLDRRCCKGNQPWRSTWLSSVNVRLRLWKVYHQFSTMLVIYAWRCYNLLRHNPMLFLWYFLIDCQVVSSVKHRGLQAFFASMQHATHTIVFSQLLINGKNEGVHAFVCQIRDAEGRWCPGIRIADCGHKTGLNGVDNGRIW